MGSANAPLTPEASMQGPPASYVGEKITPKDNAVVQLARQAAILDATKQCLVRNSVNPGSTTPHWRNTDGIFTPDNQGFPSMYARTPVKVATTAAVALSGPQTIDGVVCIAGDRVLVKDGASSPLEYSAVQAATVSTIADLGAASVVIDDVTLIETNRVLVKDQTASKDNGIYVVGAVTLGVAALTRATDMDSTGEVILDKGVPVAAGGTANGGTVFMVATVPATLGTDPLTFVLSSDAIVASEVNGVYVVASGSWTRATDTDNHDPASLFRSGLSVYVSLGTVNGKKSFYLSTPDPIIMGNTPVTFVDFTSLISKDIVKTSNVMSSIEAGMYRSL